jgi:hypothetical protein
MNVETCQYIRASRIFKSHPEVYDVFCGASPDCSWGDNEMTMVTADFVSRTLESQMPFIDDNTLQKKCDYVLKKLDSVPSNVYIDLES